MASIFEIKSQIVTETPILLFECQLASGETERWCTHELNWEGEQYRARVVRHNLFELRSSSDEGLDALSRLSITLANADSYFSQIERSTGFKGARLLVRFVFFDLRSGTSVSPATVLFRGLASSPDDITENTLRLSFVNRLSPQRSLLPEIRIQRRCPWVFPETSEQRQEAVHGGDRAGYSAFVRCGYSPDVADGLGNLNGEQAFQTCNYTRADCEARGMFDVDGSGRITRRFGGIGFVPSSILVKSFGEKSTHTNDANTNEAKYNDFVPLIYGTAWFQPPVVLARNDGNLTHLEILLGAGEIAEVVKVIANDVEIPAGRAGVNMTGTGWFNVISLGNRTGGFNLDLPGGEPYGSMAILSLVLPNRVSDGRSIPKLQVLVRGLKLPIFDINGDWVETSFSSNPAWVLLDILRRTGWTLSELDVASFGRTAQYCDEWIETMDPNGNSQMVPRFQCNLVIRKRRSAGEVIRGIRNGSALYLAYGIDGKLQLKPESTLAIQQPIRPENSNSTEALNGGWPAYEFGDGGNGFSDIVRRENGESSVRVWTRGIADSPNRFSVEFQDELNGFQQDSWSVVDAADALRTGQEVSASLPAFGLPNFSQASRITRLQLDKSIRGNTYVEFTTGLRGLGLVPGDLITLTYAREGFDRQALRILKIAPGLNCRDAVITAQLHDDIWYTGGSDAALGILGGGRQPGGETGLPRPLTGTGVWAGGLSSFDVSESHEVQSDGKVRVLLSAGFAQPRPAKPAGVRVPLVSLSCQVTDSGGQLRNDTTFYYGLSSTTPAGEESALSFLVRAETYPGADTFQVTLNDISVAAGVSAYNVYRGGNPHQLLRIASGISAGTRTFTDTGADAQEPVSPPDPNFHHANFYWRTQLSPVLPVTNHSPSAVGSTALQALDDEHRGRIVRIMSGRGAGQERTVLANSADTLTVAPWAIAPDASSTFVLAEPNWSYAASATTSPVSFEAPNVAGLTVHISGRSANAHDRECSHELSPFSVWTVQGGAPEDGDLEPPAIPDFALSAPGDGILEVGPITFEDLANVRSVGTASLRLHYWREVSGSRDVFLLSELTPGATEAMISESSSLAPGQLIQVGSEILRVLDTPAGGTLIPVERGEYQTSPATHAESTPVYVLEQTISILPISSNLFQMEDAGSYRHSISLPNVRLAAADLLVTNARGESPVRRVAFTSTVDRGIRTFSGGQISLQVEGYLAIQNNATPFLIVDGDRTVRDVVATLQEAASDLPVILEVTKDGEPYCSVSLPPGETQSESLDGFLLPPLNAGSKIGLNVVSVGPSGLSSPGRGLTVTIRL